MFTSYTSFSTSFSFSGCNLTLLFILVSLFRPAIDTLKVSTRFNYGSYMIFVSQLTTCIKCTSHSQPPGFHKGEECLIQAIYAISLRILIKALQRVYYWLEARGGTRRTGPTRLLCHAKCHRRATGFELLVMEW